LVLNDIRVPTLVLNAQNDPFMPAQFLPKVASTYVTLDYPQHGGHVGFAQGSFPGKLDWLPEKIITHLQAHG
jgi:predicted alpha/beta-fold hydrolase